MQSEFQNVPHQNDCGSKKSNSLSLFYQYQYPCFAFGCQNDQTDPHSCCHGGLQLLLLSFPLVIFFNLLTLNLEILCFLLKLKEQSLVVSLPSIECLWAETGSGDQWVAPVPEVSSYFSEQLLLSGIIIDFSFLSDSMLLFLVSCIYYRITA